LRCNAGASGGNDRGRRIEPEAVTHRRRKLALATALLALLGVAAADGSAKDELRTRLSFERALYREPDTLGVSVQRLSGALYLVGEVPTEAVRLQAEAIAKRMYVQRELRNRLRVVTRTPPHDAFAFEDKAILAKIQAALEQHSELRPFRRHLDISVEKRRAVVVGEVEGVELALALIAELRVTPGLLALNVDALRY
jgi:osmotically-inducible protein OsmY